MNDPFSIDKDRDMNDMIAENCPTISSNRRSPQRADLPQVQQTSDPYDYDEAPTNESGKATLKNHFSSPMHRFTARSPDSSDMIAINFSCLRHGVPAAYHDVYLDRIMQHLNSPVRPVNLEKMPPLKVLRRKALLNYRQKVGPKLLPKELSYGEILNSEAAKKAARYYQNLHSAEKHKANLERRVDHCKCQGEYLYRGDIKSPRTKSVVISGMTRKPLANGNPSPLILDLKCPGIHGANCKIVQKQGEQNDDVLPNLDGALSKKIQRCKGESAAERNEVAYVPDVLPHIDAVPIPTEEKLPVLNSASLRTQKRQKIGRNAPLPSIRNASILNCHTDLSHSGKTRPPPLWGSEELSLSLRVPYSKRKRGKKGLGVATREPASREWLTVKQQEDMENETLIPSMTGRVRYRSNGRFDGSSQQYGIPYVSPPQTTTSYPLPPLRDLPRGHEIRRGNTYGRDKALLSKYDDQKIHLSSLERNTRRFADGRMQGSTIEKEERPRRLPPILKNKHVKKYSSKDINIEINQWFGCSIKPPTHPPKIYASSDIERELRDIVINKDIISTKSFRRVSAPTCKTSALLPINGYTRQQSCLAPTWDQPNHPPTETLGAFMQDPVQFRRSAGQQCPRATSSYLKCTSS